MSWAQLTGQKGETQAITWLTSHGFKILGRNVKDRNGEIDVVATKQGRLHCIEVKTRTNTTFGSAVGAITPRKLAQMQRAALGFIAAHHWTGAFQLDVLCIDRGNVQYFSNVTMG